MSVSINNKLVTNNKEQISSGELQKKESNQEKKSSDTTKPKETGESTKAGARFVNEFVSKMSDSGNKLMMEIKGKIQDFLNPAGEGQKSEIQTNKFKEQNANKLAMNTMNEPTDKKAGGVNSNIRQDQDYNSKTRNPDDNTNGKFVTRYNLNAKRKKNQEDEEDDDLNHRKKRKKANLPNRKNIVIPEMLKGAVVSESGTQDMFISSGKTHQKVSAIEKKPIIQEIMEYEMSNFAWNIFDTISNHVNPKSPNGLNSSVQKDYLTVLINGLDKVEDINHESYRKYVRDVVIGTMKAAFEHTLDFKDCTKMIVSTLMNISPHDDDPKFMSDTLNIIVSELIYSKVRIGYTLRDISYNIGAAIFTLFTYYRNYQKEIDFNKELEHKFNRAVGEALWQSISKVSKNPQLAAKTNVDAFIQGRNEEESLYTKNLYKEIATTSIKKVFKK